MDTKEELLVLSEICRQDLKIITNKDKLNRLSLESQEALKAAQGLKTTISELSELKAELLKKYRVFDEKLQHEKANLRKWEARAEKIKGEREYTALMSEIGAQKRTITGVELQMSQISDELKATEEKLAKSNVAHEEKTSSAQRAYSGVKELLEEEERNLEANKKARQTLLDKIPKILRLKYERIFEKRAGQGIAFLKNSICQACMRTLPAELFIRVLKGEVVEQCPSCQRLLVADMPEQDS